jgi:hypothetical protein
MPRPSSDNGTGDSGQWSDSDGDANTDTAKAKIRKIPNKDKEISKSTNAYNVDQNMRNEDEFIYIPAIQPPANFAKYAEREAQLNCLKNENSISNSVRKNRKQINENKDDSRWRQRQRHTSSGTNLSDKPTVVNVHPKQNRDKLNGSYCESTPVTDRENSEFILDWNYPSYNSKYDSKTSNRETEYIYNKSFTKMPSYRKMSSSMNQINNIGENFQYNEDSYKKSPQLLFRQNNLSFETQIKPLSNTTKQNFSQSNGSLYTNSIKPKNIRTSLQSYFFSGNSTLKQNKNDYNSNESFEDSPKSFPIPKTYKRNFILKGHKNCGLYSGSVEKESFSNNLSDDIKNEPVFDNMSALVHKEITEAARDIGAWL